jgi:hypothetical protein
MMDDTEVRTVTRNETMGCDMRNAIWISVEGDVGETL